MTNLTGTSTAYSVSASSGVGGSNREDLEDIIYDLFPMDTWALTNLAKSKANATFHEWLGDEPAAAAANIQIEGNDATFATIANPSRYGNYTQIFDKTFMISGTQEVVSKAGRKSEIGRQALRKMKELKRDVEFSLTRNAAGTAGSNTVGRSSAGMESWIGATTPSATAATNVVLTTAAASGTYTEVTSGAPATGPTDTLAGSTAAFTEAALNLALEGAWDDGGETDVLLMTPTNKNQFNSFTSIATRNIDVGRGDQAFIVGASDVFVSSFGTHRVVQHRYMRNHSVLCLDSSLWGVATLRGFASTKLAQTGDAEKRLINVELTLRANNWKGNAQVVGMASS
jgi:hypothetical protein